MLRRLQMLIDVAMLLAAATFLAFPDSRTPKLAIGLVVLLFISGALFTWRLHLSGMLGLTPQGIMQSNRRPHNSLLSTIAIVLAVIAVVANSLH